MIVTLLTVLGRAEDGVSEWESLCLYVVHVSNVTSWLQDDTSWC
jgi:hypothetical protein